MIPHLCIVVVERASKLCSSTIATENWVKHLSSPLGTLAAERATTTDSRRSVLGSNLVQQANNASSVTVQRAVANAWAKLANANKGVWRASVTTKSDWVQLVLSENLGSNEGDAVRVDTGEPVGRELLLKR